MESIIIKKADIAMFAGRHFEVIERVSQTALNKIQTGLRMTKAEIKAVNNTKAIIEASKVVGNYYYCVRTAIESHFRKLYKDKIESPLDIDTISGNRLFIHFKDGSKPIIKDFEMIEQKNGDVKVVFI